MAEEDQEAFERAAERTRRSVKPEGGRQEGAFTHVMERIVPHFVEQAVSLPQRAFEASERMRLEGDYDPAPALETAGMMLGARSPFMGRGEVGVFGGRLAKTADHTKLAQAETMAAQGASREAIWEATGWFQGADGKWRFEISDLPAKMRGGPGDLTVGGKLEHPALFEAYPDVGKATAGYTEKPQHGSYIAPYGGVPETLKLPHDAMHHIDPKKADYAKDVMLHEVQHAIQHREGFTSGTNPGAMLEMAERQITKLPPPPPENIVRLKELIHKNIMRQITEKEAAEMNALWTIYKQHYPDPKEIAYEAYRRHAGEVEPRNVEMRADAPNEQWLKDNPPFKTEDVPREQQMGRGLKLVPVEHNPFAPKTVPVDHDPFAR